jgi:hypothetical protein
MQRIDPHFHPGARTDWHRLTATMADKIVRVSFAMA